MQATYENDLKLEHRLALCKHYNKRTGRRMVAENIKVKMSRAHCIGIALALKLDWNQ